MRDVAYVEHGHQYDTLCSTDHVMAPLSPRDPRRIARTFSDVLLRWVVRPTRGVPEYGHERMGVFDYVGLGARMGAGGLWKLFSRYVLAIVELLRVRRAHLSDAAKALRVEHERRMSAFAAATRLGIEKLRTLAALQVPPVTRSIPKIMASLLVDRIVVGLAAAIALVAVARPCRSPMVNAGHRDRGRRRPRRLGPRAAAAHVAAARMVRREARQRRDPRGARGPPGALFPAAFVVMGHTHTPARIPIAEGAATYVNVGSWHEGESDDAGAYRAARTHLVIHPAGAGAEAEFLAWGAEGPTPLRPQHSPTS